MAEDRTDSLGERTEQPTPPRLKEARDRGQVPRSAELTSAAAVLAGLLALALLGPGLLVEMTKMTATFLEADPGASGRSEGLRELVARGAAGSLARVGGMLAVVAGVVAGVGLLQVGPLAATKRLRPDLGRLSPAAGLRRLLSTRTIARAVATLAKIVLVGAAAYVVLGPLLPRLAAASGMAPSRLAGEAGRLAAGLALRIAMGLLVLAGADWLYQRWQHRRDLRMTRREWLQDMRKMEGDPRLRRRRREVGRQLTDWRIGRSVRSAAVVLSEPHGRAAALRYDATGGAPRVVAKGTGLSALRIRRSAEVAGVPVVTDAAAARAVCGACRTGEEVPEPLYETVAEHLAAAAAGAGREGPRGSGVTNG